MRLNNIAMYNARIENEQQKQREQILNSNHVSEITKGIDADDQLLQRYLHLIQTAKNATGETGVVDSPPPAVRAEHPSSPAHKHTLVVAKTPLRKYREREYDRVAPATKLKTTTMRSSSPHIEEYVVFECEAREFQLSLGNMRLLLKSQERDLYHPCLSKITQIATLKRTLEYYEN